MSPDTIHLTIVIQGVEYSVAYGPSTKTAIISGPLTAGTKPPILHMIGQLEGVETARTACEEWLNAGPAGEKKT